MTQDRGSPTSPHIWISWENPHSHIMKELESSHAILMWGETKWLVVIILYVSAFKLSQHKRIKLIGFSISWQIKLFLSPDKWIDRNLTVHTIPIVYLFRHTLHFVWENYWCPSGSIFSHTENYSKAYFQEVRLGDRKVKIRVVRSAPPRILSSRKA